MKHLICAAALDDRLRPVLPQPAHRLRKKRRSLRTAMRPLTPHMPHRIAGKGQRTLHRLIGHPPVTAIGIVIMLTVLQKDTDRLGLILPDQDGIAVAATKPDIRA